MYESFSCRRTDNEFINMSFNLGVPFLLWYLHPTVTLFLILHQNKHRCFLVCNWSISPMYSRKHSSSDRLYKNAYTNHIHIGIHLKRNSQFLFRSRRLMSVLYCTVLSYQFRYNFNYYLYVSSISFPID